MSDMGLERREMSKAWIKDCRNRFIRLLASILAVGGLSLLGAAATIAPGAGSSPSEVLFEGFANPLEQEVLEPVLTQLDDGRYWLLFGDKGKRLAGQFSSDFGRTWTGTTVVHAADGSEIPLGSIAAHLSLVHLHSGALGMIYGGPRSRPGRDGTLLYRTSRDQGKTWSPPRAIDPFYAICHSGSARVLRAGRIVVPAFNWSSPAAGGESEDANNNINISWVYYSDDEGKTWQRSLSELFVSIDHGRRGVYSFEEPSLEELRDGRVLMFGRTELGQFYQSISKDGGVSSSNPTPVPLPSSYTLPMIVRVPATGDLLLAWNQASGEEILAGLSRHRLSTAISKDDGVSWTSFHNLESADDRVRLDPPPSTPEVYRMQDYEYRMPVDRDRYKHASEWVRICYPTIAFHQNEVAFAYDYGNGGADGHPEAVATKIKVVSIDWLYSKKGKQ